jgi:hypothetical protein
VTKNELRSSIPDARVLVLNRRSTLSLAQQTLKSTSSFSQERRFARFAAETKTPIMMADKTKLSPTGCTAVLQLGQETLPPLED